MVALADAGFTVLYGNPRGSQGYGEAFGKAIEGNWGEADDSDLMRLVDWALRQKLATRDHVGLLGLSYGGYMTNWLLGHHPGRFAAAVSENPVLDLFSFYGESDYGFTIAEHVGGIDEPWNDFQRMIESLPARCCTATRRHSSSSRPRATCVAPRARPRSRSRCSAGSAARSRWCATPRSST